MSLIPDELESVHPQPTKLASNFNLTTSNSFSTNTSPKFNFPINCRPSFADHLLVTSDTYQLTAATISVIMITLGLLFNGLIIFALWKRNERTETPQFRFTLNIAATDLIMCLLLQSIRIAVLMCGNKWTLGDEMCQFHGWLGVCLIHVSLINASLITLDRYIGCCYPLRYHQILSDKKVRALIIGGWIFASLVALPPLFGWGCYRYLPAISACTVTLPPDFKRDLTQSTYITFLAIIGLIYFITIGFYYSNIIWARRKLIQRTESLQSLSGSHGSLHTVDFDVRKGVILIGVVLLTLSITWLPLVAEVMSYIVLFYTQSAASFMLGNALSVQCIVFALSHVLNPIVYGFTNHHVRKEIRYHLGCKVSEREPLMRIVSKERRLK